MLSPSFLDVLSIVELGTRRFRATSRVAGHAPHISYDLTCPTSCNRSATPKTVVSGVPRLSLDRRPATFLPRVSHGCLAARVARGGEEARSTASAPQAAERLCRSFWRPRIRSPKLSTVSTSSSKAFLTFPGDCLALAPSCAAREARARDLRSTGATGVPRSDRHVDIAPQRFSVFPIRSAGTSRRFDDSDELLAGNRLRASVSAKKTVQFQHRVGWHCLCSPGQLVDGIDQRRRTEP